MSTPGKPSKSRNRRTSTARSRAVDANGGVVDLFCGVGGLSLGFKRAGFKVAGGIDIDLNARYAYERYTGGTFLAADIARLDAKIVDDLLGTGRPRIIVGCAPCQGFSDYNRKNHGSAWNLLPAFAKIVESCKPDIVSMENVASLVEYRDGRTLKAFVDRLCRAGYDVSWYIVSGADYGISQRRKRLILFGSRRGFIELVPATHRRVRTLREVIGDLPSLRAGSIDSGDRFHRAQRLSPENAERMKNTTQGGSWRQWPSHLRLPCHSTKRGAEFGSVYGRLSWDKIGPTVTTQFFKIGTGRFGHPTQRRGLSLREGGLIQTFPRNFQFGDPDKPIAFDVIGRLIGNAVPIRLGEIVARSIRRHIGEEF